LKQERLRVAEVARACLAVEYDNLAGIFGNGGSASSHSVRIRLLRARRRFRPKAFTRPLKVFLTIVARRAGVFTSEGLAESRCTIRGCSYSRRTVILKRSASGIFNSANAFLELRLALSLGKLPDDALVSRPRLARRPSRDDRGISASHGREAPRPKVSPRSRCTRCGMRTPRGLCTPLPAPRRQGRGRG
jgi:hypothetical protein